MTTVCGDLVYSSQVFVISLDITTVFPSISF